jgi:NAD(P)-dependent dehydrogenase (short-subunit alcohol dehydrogenase family)
MKRHTIIFTGASSGIGKEVGRHFLANGDNVVINCSTAEKLEKVYQELGGGENPDVLVNNAGIFETMPFLEVDQVYLDHFLNTNLKDTYFTLMTISTQLITHNK